MTSPVNIIKTTLEVKDYNDLTPDYIAQLRKLTLGGYSGLNHELDNFEKITETRKVKCKIITATVNAKPKLILNTTTELIGWAIASKEQSNFYFPGDGLFDPSMGVLFEVYVKPTFRSKGIGKRILRKTQRTFPTETLCICPWDGRSQGFFDSVKRKREFLFL